MAKFTKDQSIKDFQRFIREVYSVTNDRLYSTWDLLTHIQRFAMRGMKGVRRNDKKKIEQNLLISFAFLMAVANRLHIDAEEELWWRFPGLCPYCGRVPCTCRHGKRPSNRKKKLIESIDGRPQSLNDYQKLFDQIYPAKGTSLVNTSIHFAEEVGELAEAVQTFSGRHTRKHFDDVLLELADLVSNVFTFANSAKINLAESLEKMYSDSCNVCHKSPCVCHFAKVAVMKS